MADTSNGTTNTKVAVITGASSGIGRATAIEFAKNGYDIVLAARRQSELQNVAEVCEQFGIRPMIVVADATDESAVQKIADVANVTFGHFDIWVNNAAVSLYAKFEDTPLKDFQQVINTNLMGYVYGCRAAIQQFKEQSHGTLINVSSINAAAPLPYASAYVASKYAIRGLTESIRMELEDQGLSKQIRVCNVMPASVDTNLFQNAANYTNREVVALEPVYDPVTVAKQIVKLAKCPRREIIIGSAGKMMVAKHTKRPLLYEKIVSKFAAKNNFSDNSVENTTGNLYEPIAEHTGVHGGWRDRRMSGSTFNAIVSGVTIAALAAVGAGVLLAQKARSKS